MVPTHRHADGGYYRLYATDIAGKSEGPEGEWVEGVLYQSVIDGKVRWTSRVRWDKRFTAVNPELITERIHELVDDQDDFIGSFIFRIYEVDDIRYLLIKAGPQPNSRLEPEQLQHIRRVLNAMAEAIGQGLHTRDHDFPDLIGDVNAFHAKFGQEYVGKPRLLPQDLHDFRVKFHDEETSEYKDEYPKLVEAISRKDRRDIINSLELQLDALADAVWVVLGTADLQFGRAAFIEAWRRVVKANMAKVRKDQAEDGHEDSGRAPKYDIVKPAGWTAPDHRDLVSDNAIFDEIFALPAPEVETNTFNQDAGS